VKKVSGATTTVYVFSGTKVIAEYENGAAVGAPTREYIYTGSQLLAKIEGGVTTYSHPDHLSAGVMTNTSGTIAAQSGHYPFGESWYESGGTNKLKFTSYDRDTANGESGNDYAIFRSYVSRLGRFSSPDPLAGDIADPQTLARYAYVRDDPVNSVDPLGLLECQVNGVPWNCEAGAFWNFMEMGHNARFSFQFGPSFPLTAPGGASGLSSGPGIDSSHIFQFHGVTYEVQVRILSWRALEIGFGPGSLPIESAWMLLTNSAGPRELQPRTPESRDSFLATIANFLQSNRRQGEAFSDCVFRNANEATFGGHRAIIGGLLGTSTAALMNTIQLPMIPGLPPVTLSSHIGRWIGGAVFLASGGYVRGFPVARVAATAIGAAGRAAPYVAAAEAGLLIGSAFNCR